MDDDSKSTDKSDDSSSPPIVQITVVDTLSEEEVAAGSSLNNDINNEEARSDFENVEIPKHKFIKHIQDVGCTKNELKVKRYRAVMILAYGTKENKVYY